MNVIGHDHIATYCDVKVVLGALGKRTNAIWISSFARTGLSLVRAERDEIKRAFCEYTSQARWPFSEGPLHGKSYNPLNKTVAAAGMVVATALRAVFE
jgi:hypothetical protein